MNSTSRQEAVLEILKLSHLKSLRNLHFFNDFNYQYTIYGIGICQLLLNLAVIFTIIFYKLSNNKSNVQKSGSYVFLFILNLAVEDTLGFAITITHLIYDEWMFEANYWLDEPRLFYQRLEHGCKVQTGIMSFVYVHSLLSTMFLTLERYFLITKPFTYDKVSLRIS